MFRRTILGELKRWAAQPDRKPLILRGARQVGKTTAVEIFSADFDTYVHFDLEKPEDAELFERGLPVQELIQAIYLAKSITPSEGRTLLFIDEIQNSASAMAMMRQFYESAKDIHVIGAGSLLEIMIREEQKSFPVGRVQFLFMYPLTFEEYLGAIGADEALEYYNKVPLPDLAFPTLRKHFHRYALLGGMPEIIEVYQEREDIAALTPVYQGLLTSYVDDVSKYARNDTMIEVIRHVIEAAPLEAGKRIKFDGFGKSNYRSREVGEALRTLERAMLVYLHYPTSSTEPPVLPNKRRSPKLQFLDTGLINFYVGLQEQFFKYEDVGSFYRGILAEHLTGQELLASDPTRQRKLSFWTREKPQSSAEVDFVVQHGEYVIPVEVKSGAVGSLRSLQEFVDRASHPFAVRIFGGALSPNVNASTRKGKSYRLLNLPYFLTGKLQDYLRWFIAA
ncbi:ATP-binding protein [Candidatus Eisenbacteria bacterium]|uniref:ATP-binding protein n=1 Tax=Eiseniibacteriota bacterium TaxID=2212470 RepID=A0ABV6YP61_UNCEI